MNIDTRGKRVNVRILFCQARRTGVHFVLGTNPSSSTSRLPTCICPEKQRETGGHLAAQQYARGYRKVNSGCNATVSVGWTHPMQTCPRANVSPVSRRCFSERRSLSHMTKTVEDGGRTWLCGCKLCPMSHSSSVFSIIKKKKNHSSRAALACFAR